MKKIVMGIGLLVVSGIFIFATATNQKETVHVDYPKTTHVVSLKYMYTFK